MRIRRVMSVALGLLLVVSSAPVLAVAQNSGVSTDAKTVNVELIIDASGSMAEALPDGELRIDAAKRVLLDVIDNLPERAGINVGLRVYGHLGDNTDAGKAESCWSSELFVPMDGIDRQALSDEINAVEPTGWTPIAYSLEQATGDFEPGGESVINAIVLVTDGEETCSPPEDACSAAAALQAANVAVTTHVVGLALTEAQSAQVSCIAQQGGGQFFDADDADELAGAIDSVLVDIEVQQPTPKTSAATPLDEIVTMAFHEITDWEIAPNEGYGGQGEAAPLLSDDGETIILGWANDSSDPESLSTVWAMNADGSNLRQIDGYLPQCNCYSYFDVSADGATVAITDSTQIRVASSNGSTGQQLLALASNEINGMRISGDGRTIVFRVYRDTAFTGDSGTDPISRGLYAINVDGSNFRRLVGPEEMAPRLNVTAADVPFFGGTWGLDVSFDGGVIAFVSFITPQAGGSGQGLFVTSLDGGVPRMLLSRTSYVTNGAVSPDGSTIAYISFDNTVGLEQVGIVTPNGFGQRVLTDNTRETGIGMSMPSGERIQLSNDGTRLNLGSNALLLDTVTGARLTFSVNDRMSVSGDPPTLLNGTTYRSSMSADAAHVIFLLADELGVLQLIRMDVNPTSLDGAPEVSNAGADPTFVMPASASLATATVDVATENEFVRVGVAVLRDGMPDGGVGAAYYGPLLDDGATNGDTAAGDGTYTTDKIASDCCAPEGPRTLRFRAETLDGNGLRHATTIDVRPFAVGASAPPEEEESTDTTTAAVPAARPTKEPEPTAAGTTAKRQPGGIDLSEWTGQPDPAGCVTDRMSAEEFVTALESAIESPPESTVPQSVASIDELPAGEPVEDDADALAALQTLFEAGACLNAGDLGALLALFTPAGLGRAVTAAFGGAGGAEPMTADERAETIASVEAVFANPTPPTTDADRATIDRIVSVSAIADGRIMIVMEGNSPIVSGMAAFFLTEVDGRWLIDETCAIGDGSTLQPPST